CHTYLDGTERHEFTQFESRCVCGRGTPPFETGHWSLPAMIVPDLKYALRTLRGTPAVTFTAMAALALGIGANTAVFTLVDAVLFRPLHYPRPDRIVEVTRNYPDGGAVNAVTAFKFS